ncbi:hypothetical protein SARC_09801 [Sphaeroforma arctica JP610]|uniref:ubiquitinyl hydrolase 1 n=1 Tax=Sphaeroforma arctica JP610 TaxID=667725 RepID=A0A0L0FLU1_9EUKA|nr:hypothetical protein SARC_09801 [Sphaeroforma arctica JP610]KNC77747.1 hypothetical protein SARC_09801 [Sphaeroforma arctica JP610]|eukprot:XP_014151649.1 hypothetical protein SARC_09801 [Sphaeroforma arctica JP610]
MDLRTCLLQGPGANYVPGHSNHPYPDVQHRLAHWKTVANWVVTEATQHDEHELRIYALPSAFIVAESTRRRDVMDLCDQLFTLTIVMIPRPAPGETARLFCTEPYRGEYTLSDLTEQLSEDKLGDLTELQTKYSDVNCDVDSELLVESFVGYVFERILNHASDDLVLVKFQLRLAAWFNSEELSVREFQSFYALVDALDENTRALYLIEERLQDARQHLYDENCVKAEEKSKITDHLPSQSISSLPDTSYQINTEKLSCEPLNVDSIGLGIYAEPIVSIPALFTLEDVVALSRATTEFPDHLVLYAVESWLATFLGTASSDTNFNVDLEILAGVAKWLLDLVQRTSISSDAHHYSECVVSHRRLVASAFVCLNHILIVREYPEAEQFSLGLPNWSSHYRLSSDSALELHRQIGDYIKPFLARPEVPALGLEHPQGWIQLANLVVREDDADFLEALQSQDKQRTALWNNTIVPLQRRYRRAEKELARLVIEQMMHEAKIDELNSELVSLKEVLSSVERQMNDKKEYHQGKKEARDTARKAKTAALDRAEDLEAVIDKKKRDLDVLKKERSASAKTFENKLGYQSIFTESLEQTKRKKHERKLRMEDVQSQLKTLVQRVEALETGILTLQLGSSSNLYGFEGKLWNLSRLQNAVVGENTKKGELEAALQELESASVTGDDLDIAGALDDAKSDTTKLKDLYDETMKKSDSNIEIAEGHIVELETQLQKAVLEADFRKEAFVWAQKTLADTDDGSEFYVEIRRLSKEVNELENRISQKQETVKSLKKESDDQREKMTETDRPFYPKFTELPHSRTQARNHLFFKEKMTPKLDNFALSLYNLPCYTKTRISAGNEFPGQFKTMVSYRRRKSLIAVKVMDMDINDWTKDGLDYADLQYKDIYIVWKFDDNVWEFKLNGVDGALFVPDIKSDSKWALTTVGISASDDSTRSNEWVAHTEQLSEADGEAVGRVLAFPRQSWMELVAFIRTQDLQLSTDFASRIRIENAISVVMDLVRRVGPLDPDTGDYIWASGVKCDSAIWEIFRSIIDNNANNPHNVVVLWLTAEALNRLVQLGLDEALPVLHHCAKQCSQLPRDSFMVNAVCTVVAAYSFERAREPDDSRKASEYLLAARIAAYGCRPSDHAFLNEAPELLKTILERTLERICVTWIANLDKDNCIVDRVLNSFWNSDATRDWSNSGSSLFVCRYPSYELDVLTGEIRIDMKHAGPLPRSLIAQSSWKQLFGDTVFPEMVKSDDVYTSLPDVPFPHYTIRTDEKGQLSGVRAEYENEVTLTTGVSDASCVINTMPREMYTRTPWYDKHRDRVVFMDTTGTVLEVAEADGKSNGRYNIVYVEDNRVNKENSWAAEGFISEILPTQKRLLHVCDELQLWTDVLARVEDQEHIELSSLYVPSIDQFKLTWKLYRWSAIGLSFEQTLGQIAWRSMEYDGYEMAREQHCPHIWGQSRNYLRLVATDPNEAVRLPDIFLLRELDPHTTSLMESSEVHITYHEYTIHPTLGELRARTMEGLLYLAVESLRHHDGLPLTDSNVMTGEERATECLRRALAVDTLSPNSSTERSLRMIESLCSSVQSPIYQMCALVRHQAAILGSLNESASEDLEHTLRTQAEIDSKVETCMRLGPRLQLPASLLLQSDSIDSSLKADVRSFQTINIEPVPYTTSAGKHEAKLNCMLAVLGQDSRSDSIEETDSKLKFPLEGLKAVTEHMENLIQSTKESWEEYQNIIPVKPVVDEMRPIIWEIQREGRVARDKLVAYIDSAMRRITKEDPLNWKVRQIVGFIPQFSRIDYVRAILDEKHILSFTPYLSLVSVERVRDALFAWAELVVLLDRCSRLLAPNITLNSLIVELETKRSYDIRTYPEWLVFELDGRLQIRNDQQAAVAELVKAMGPNLSDTQLKPMMLQMGIGSGKTRVVMPLLALHINSKVYACIEHHPHKLCRVLVPEPLLDEAYAAFITSLSLSTLAQPVIRMPFSRQSSISEKDMDLLYRHLSLLRVHGAMVMSAPAHINSARLKTVEEVEDTNWSRMPQTFVNPNLFVDIVDECDEVFRPGSELVYAVGEVRYDGADSPTSLLRIRVIEIVLELAWSYQEDLGEAVVPWCDFCKELLHRVFNLPSRAGNLAWLDEARDRDVIVGTEEPDMDEYKDSESTQLLMLRGLFSFGLLANLWERRYRVHYGIDETETTYKKKRLAVPFRANDTPSHKSEFARLDLVIGFTIMSYYHKGLTLHQVGEAYRRLLQLNINQREAEYKYWTADLDNDSSCPRSVKDITDADIEQLAAVVGNKRTVIHFWLNQCLFPTELQTYPLSISTNSWHLMSGSHRIVGFSGTRDLGLLSPHATEMGYVKGHKGANGRMLTLTNRVKDEDVYPVGKGAEVISDLISIAKNRQVDAIIDAGALFQGHTPAEIAVRLRAELPPSKYRRGIVYHTPEGWRTLPSDQSTKSQDMATCTIPVHQCLVLYDQEHTRGVDMQLRHDAFALVTVGPDLTRDAFMQAIGRLRLLDGNQRFGLVIPQNILDKTDCIAPTEEWTRTQRLLGWLLQNTDHAVQYNVVNWVEQAIHFRATDAARRRNQQPRELKFAGFGGPLAARTTMTTNQAGGFGAKTTNQAGGFGAKTTDAQKPSFGTPASASFGAPAPPNTDAWYLDDQDQPDKLYGISCRVEPPAIRAIELLEANAHHFNDDLTGKCLLITLQHTVKSLKPNEDSLPVNTDHGFNTFVQREMQQHQEQEIAMEVASAVYTPAIDPNEREVMRTMAVNGSAIESRLLCSANFEAKAATGTHPIYKYVGPLCYNADDNTYEVLTQREAEWYMEENKQLLHLNVHNTEPFTALLSVYNGYLSLDSEDRRRFLVTCDDETALAALRSVIDSRRLAASIPDSHFGQALINARMI